MVKIAPLLGISNISSPDCLIKRTKKIPENFISKIDDVTAGDIPEWHNVKSDHEDKNMNVRGSTEELCRPELHQWFSYGTHEHYQQWKILITLFLNQGEHFC